MRVFSLSDLAGKTPEENAEIYSMVDCIEDLWQHIAAMFREQDEAIKVYNNNNGFQSLKRFTQFTG